MLHHLLTVPDLTRADLELLLDRAEVFRAAPDSARTLLVGRVVACLFAQPSTRTRLSFAAAVARLGGIPVMTAPHELQLGEGESIEDTARVLSSYTVAIVARVQSHEQLTALASHASVPVINAMTAHHHPCQSLTDLFTLRREFGKLGGLHVAFVGKATCIATSLIAACALAGVDISLACPPGHAPDPAFAREKGELASRNGSRISIGEDPRAAVRGAHAVYTDLWCDDEAPGRSHFPPELIQAYSVNEALMQATGGKAIFLHCLPARRGEEVTAEVIDGPRSRVLDQVANRLPVQQAILAALLEQELVGASPSSSP